MLTYYIYVPLKNQISPRLSEKYCALLFFVQIFANLNFTCSVVKFKSALSKAKNIVPCPTAFKFLV